MTINIEKLTSGFYAVFVNGEWVDAASATIEQAKAKAKDIVSLENKRQNKANLFENITVNVKG